jgi:hypothetical protein
MERVQLFSPTGQLVATVDVPRTGFPPDIIEWTGRSFVLRSGRYMEGLRCVVPVLLGNATAA